MKGLISDALDKAVQRLVGSHITLSEQYALAAALTEARLACDGLEVKHGLCQCGRGDHAHGYEPCSVLGTRFRVGKRADRVVQFSFCAACDDHAPDSGCIDREAPRWPETP